MNVKHSCESEMELGFHTLSLSSDVKSFLTVLPASPGHVNTNTGEGAAVCASDNANAPSNQLCLRSIWQTCSPCERKRMNYVTGSHSVPTGGKGLLSVLPLGDLAEMQHARLGLSTPRLLYFSNRPLGGQHREEERRRCLFPRQ